MKLRRLKLSRITNYEEEIITFSRINVILGFNAAGKSTIKDAIQKAITGNSRRNLLSSGAKSGEIEAEIDDLKLKRKIWKDRQELKVSDENGRWNGTMTELEEKFLDYYETNRDTMESLFNTEGFLSLSSKEQANFLFKLLNLKIKREEFKPYLKDVSFLPEEIPLKLLDKFYERFYLERRDSRKKLKVLESQLLPIQESTSKNLPKLEKELKEKEAEKEKLLIANAQSSQLKENIELLKERKKELENSLKRRQSLQKEFALLEKEIKTIEGSQVEIDPQMGIKKELLSNLSSDKCPLCGKTLSIEEIEELLNELENKIQKSGNFKILAEKKEQLARVNQALNSLPEIDISKRELIEKEIKVKTEQLNKNPANYSKKLSEISGSISLLKKEIEKIKLKEREFARQKKLRTEVKQETTRLKKLEEVVKILEPGGVKDKILMKFLSPVEKKLHSILSTLTEGKYTLKLSFDKEFQITLFKEDKVLHFPDLSDSEKLTLGLIFQYAFAVLTNLRFLIMDRVETLDLVKRRNLLQFLLEKKDEFDTVILLTVPSFKIQNPRLPETDFLWVEEGHVRSVE